MFKAPRCVTLVSFALAAAFVMPGAQAASTAQCKALSQKACGAAPACTWVDGYMRKDGRKVSAYCRKAPQHKAKQSAVKTPAPLAKALKKQG